MTRVYGVAVLLLVILGFTASASGQRSSQVDGVFYYQPAASVFGAEAVWVNPAGLAMYRASSFQLLLDLEDGRFGKSWGWAVNSRRLATAYRRVESRSNSDDWQEYVFASSMALGQNAALGGSYRYYKEAPDHRHKQHTWNLGLMMGGRHGFRIGALLSNLNHSRNAGGEQTETEMRYSLAYRPRGHGLTLAADMFLSTGTRFSNADYVYQASFNTGQGLVFEATLEPDQAWQVGLRVNLNRYFVGSKSRYTSSGHDRTTFVVGATSLRQHSLWTGPSRRLNVSLSGSIDENPPQPILGRERTPYVRMLLDIYRAAEDPTIAEMVLNLRAGRLGFGRTQELRRALVHFKESGKRLVCHLSRAGNLDYYLASVCDQILIDPVGQLGLVGLRAELTFYGGTLDKIGAGVEMVQIGPHKSAAEKYTRSQASPENRAQVNRLLDDLYDQLVADLAEARGLTTDAVRKIIDNGPFTSEEALAAGLVDGLSYRQDVARDFLRPMAAISFRRYMADTLLNDGWPARPQLGVIVADGDIDSREEGLPIVYSGRKATPAGMQRALAQVGRNANVRGLVLRVNSPGGLALAGEEMYRSLKEATRRRPLVVSMANRAASGGYYIAMPGEYLFANPATVTGSIGIYAGKPDLSRLYDKLGIGKELFTRGRYAGMMSWIRPFSEEERTKFASQIEAFYDHFLDLVADNRGLAYDSVDALAQGQVWTGREAAANGLIDQLGGLKEALDYSAERLGLSEYEVAVYPQKRPWIELPGQSLLEPLLSLSRLWGSSESDDHPPGPIPEGVYARMPYDLNIE